LRQYPKKTDYSLGGYSHPQSAGRAPDEDEIINFAIKKGNYGVHIEAIIDFIVNKSTLDIDIR
jgi:hypothetical protein